MSRKTTVIRDLDTLIHLLQCARLDRDPDETMALQIPEVTVVIVRAAPSGVVLSVAVESPI